MRTDLQEVFMDNESTCITGSETYGLFVMLATSQGQAICCMSGFRSQEKAVAARDILRKKFLFVGSGFSCTVLPMGEVPQSEMSKGAEYELFIKMDAPGLSLSSATFHSLKRAEEESTRLMKSFQGRVSLATLEK